MRVSGMSAVVCAILAGLVVSTAEADYSSQSHVPGQMEASFLVNLFKFVAWPRVSATATICFLQASQVESRLEFGLSTHQKWAQLRDRTLVIKTLNDPTEVSDPTAAAGCQIL